MVLPTKRVTGTSLQAIPVVLSTEFEKSKEREERPSSGR